MVQGQDHHNIEEEWYMAASHETSLMELSYPSPYGAAPDTPRSSFNVNMLDSPLSFDNTNTLLTNFRTAPALGMGMESNRILDELAGNNAGGQGLLSSISSGKFLMQCTAISFLPTSTCHQVQWWCFIPYIPCKSIQLKKNLCFIRSRRSFLQVILHFNAVQHPFKFCMSSRMLMMLHIIYPL